MKKKLMALFLVLAMVMSLSIAAFAGEIGDGEGTPQTEYTDMSTVVIKKTYELTNAGTSSPAETFNFTIVRSSVSDSADGVTVDNMPIPTISSVTYNAGEAGGTNKTKNITVTLPEYSSVGVYTYTINETAGNKAGVTYRTGAIKLVVTVVEENGLKRIAAVHTEDENGTKSDAFSDNEYSAGSLAISKTVTGNMGDKSKYFKVTVKLTGETGKSYAESYSVSGGSYSSNPTTITVNAETGTDFYLKDGETITIANLPYGVTYTVEEVNYASDGYDADYSFSDSGKKIDSASDTVDITNNKGVTVDTGITMDSLPYMMLLALVAVAAVVFFSRKRMARED